MKHGDVDNIYRIVNEDHDDLDLTRTQALRVYAQLAAVLFPTATRPGGSATTSRARVRPARSTPIKTQPQSSQCGQSA